MTTAVAVITLAACVGRGFPSRVVEPIKVGVITDIEDVTGADVVVFGGHRLRLPTDEPHPRISIDALMLHWGDAEPPFVTFAPRMGEECFGYQPAAAFNEPDAIVIVTDDNLNLGIRLPKAEGYAADPLEYDAETGQFVQPAPDFCVNEAGEIVLGGEL